MKAGQMISSFDDEVLSHRESQLHQRGHFTIYNCDLVELLEADYGDALDPTDVQLRRVAVH
ncbi:hypothetical protein GN244_ATG00940 [Phytophthora infestans]|uniref:Uncharacterized protein n=1 Tax=Phytophthora infestans TaxID=4787 RepID=A0A833WQ87_PHYIN|nr:hypothetical protein GN244_ATG00940 [Phytophthora infestans]KAF4130211.1 hypothetical protein GN958_ATG20626 [Phytophthora infestans]